MPIFLTLAAMAMQVGPDPMGGQVAGVPDELRNRPPRRGAAVVAAETPGSPALGVCLDTARTDPAKAVALGESWVVRTKGAQRAAGRHCLGVAKGNRGDWAGAARSFLAAREEASDQRFRARMGALAGSALLADGKPQEALDVLDAARGDAAGEALLGGAILEDRATALVALGKPADAAAALAEARTLVPDDAHVWLLSATLSRRQDDLAAAQAQIEQAARLAPLDPAIGLEAGVIAALGGRDAAARKSFESVIAAAPDSEQATTAKGYLAQLAPRPRDAAPSSQGPS